MASEPPQVRRRPTRAKPGGVDRNSSVVRASVLETALELGFSQNSTVANWIFNNPLTEEAEEIYPEPDTQVNPDTKSDLAPDVAGATTPALTSGSNSTSDESSSLNSPSNASNAVATTIQVHAHKPSVTESPYVHFGDFPADQLQLFSPFSLSPHDAKHKGTRGNSAGKFPRDNERSHSQDDGLRHNATRESPGLGSADTGYTSEGQYLSKTKTSNKDKFRKPKGNKGSKSPNSDASKTGEKDGGYTSDGGYLSASSNKSLGKSSGKVKSRAMAFFRRRPKKSARASDDEDEDYIPPVPAIPVLTRPSSPKPLERRAASPARTGYSPLTLNLTPPASPSRRRVSKSPPPVHPRVMLPQESNHFTVSQRPASPLIAPASTPTVLTPAATPATFPLPPSIPGTPLSTASFPAAASPSMQHATGVPKQLVTSSSRQHLSIPPPVPPPTLPLPQPPLSPSMSYNGLSLPSPATPITPSRKGAPNRPIPVVPTTPGATRPLTPHRTASPFRPLLSPRAASASGSSFRMAESTNAYEGDQLNSKEVSGRQRSATAGFGSTPAFLQRKMQHGPPPSPRHPPPDVPLPPSPCPNPGSRPRTPIGIPSKFHEHFSSVSSVPLSQVLSTPTTLSPSPSIIALSESSSGPSVRSSRVSSTSEHGEGPPNRNLMNTPEYSRPTTSTSVITESSYGKPVSSTFGRSYGSTLNLKSHFSDRSDVSSSVYSRMMHTGSVTTFNDDVDVDDSAPKSDDDASVYPSEDKTAGRRTMYLMEHGELDENGNETVMAESRYWGGREMAPPLPPLPPMPTRPGPGYF